MRRLLGVMVLAVVISCAWAQDGGRRGEGRGAWRGEPMRHPLLELAQRQALRLRYTGVRRVETRVGTEARRNVERVWFDQGRQRVEFEKGSTNFGQVIVVANGRRQHFFPETNEIQVRPAPQHEPMMRFFEGNPGLRRRTTIKESNGGTIAGQSTTALTFTDPSGNVISRIWIDPSNGMVLKREAFDATGRLVGGMEFISVNYRPTISDRDFRIERRGATIVTVETVLQRMAERLDVRPFRIPNDTAGLQLESVRPINLGNGARALSQTYVDGNGRRVSLFVVAGSVDPNRLRRMQGPSLASAVRRVDETTLILVGSLSQSDLDGLLARVR